jgi:acetate kinase
MRVLVFNPGSNSLKFQVIDACPTAWGRKEIVGAFEPIGRDTAFAASVPGGGRLLEERRPIENQGAGAAELLSRIDAGVFRDAGVRRLSDLELIACRVVHGASRFRKPVKVDAAVLAGIEALDDLAPLHNAQADIACRSSPFSIPRFTPRFQRSRLDMRSTTISRNATASVASAFTESHTNI